MEHLERMVNEMYVIGINEWDFLNIETRTLTRLESYNIWCEVKKVTYKCNLSKATIFPDYESTVKTVEEIKKRKSEIEFKNDSIIGQIIDEEKGKEFDVEALKIYELIPTECKNME